MSIRKRGLSHKWRKLMSFLMRISAKHNLTNPLKNESIEKCGRTVHVTL